MFLEVGINTATAHWPHRRTLSLGSLLCGIGFGALAWSTSFWQVGATVVIWTFGEMFIFPGMADYLTDIAPESRRGEYMGLSQMMMGLAFMRRAVGGPADPRRSSAEKPSGFPMLALGLAAAAMMARLQGTGPRRRRGAVPLPTTAPSTEP